MKRDFPSLTCDLLSDAAEAGGAGETLFISGTASIVGHRSMHPGDAGAQTAETLSDLLLEIEALGCREADAQTQPGRTEDRQ